MKDSRGEIVTEDAQIRERRKEYYQQLTNVENPRMKLLIEAAKKREADGVRVEELVAAMKMMKRGKAVGPGDIPTEAWKVIRRTGVEWLTEVFSNIMETEHMTDEWRSSTLIPILINKRDIQDCANDQGIKRTSHTP